MSSELLFSVRGIPVAQGGASAFVVGGRARIVTRGRDPRTPLGSWRTALAAAAGEAMGDDPLRLGPVAVIVTFVFPRPKGHYLPAGQRRAVRELRADAPLFVSGTPDLDKLQRALLDALTGVVVRDDAQVARIRAAKRYEDPETYPGATVEVVDLPATR